MADHVKCFSAEPIVLKVEEALVRTYTLILWRGFETICGVIVPETRG